MLDIGHPSPCNEICASADIMFGRHHILAEIEGHGMKDVHVRQTISIVGGSEGVQAMPLYPVYKYPSIAAIGVTSRSRLPLGLNDGAESIDPSAPVPIRKVLKLLYKSLESRFRVRRAPLNRRDRRAFEASHQ